MSAFGFVGFRGSLIACRTRLYTPDCIRQFILEQAHAYYELNNCFPLGYNGPPLRRRRQSTPSTRDVSMEVLDADGDDFMSEKTFSFEIADDDEDEDANNDEVDDAMDEESDEWEEVDYGVDDDDDDDDSDDDEDMIEVLVQQAHQAAAAGLSGDEDAEGEMEIDIEAFSDPSFNAELSSPTPPAMPVGPHEPVAGIESGFYVPPQNPYQLQHSPPPQVVQPTPAQQQYAQLQLPQYTVQYNEHLRQQVVVPVPPMYQQYLFANPPIQPLPPPRMAPILVAQLRNTEGGGPRLMGRGTPSNRVRAVQWAKGFAAWRAASDAAAESLIRESRRSQSPNTAVQLTPLQSGDRSEPLLRLVLDGQDALAAVVDQQVRQMEEMRLHLERQQELRAQQQAIQQQMQLAEAVQEPAWENFLTNFDDRNSELAHAVPSTSSSGPNQDASSSGSGSSSGSSLGQQIAASPSPSPYATPRVGSPPPPVASSEGQMFGDMGMFDTNLGFANMMNNPSGSEWYAPTLPSSGADPNAGTAPDADAGEGGASVAGGGEHTEHTEGHGAVGGTSTLSFALG